MPRTVDHVVRRGELTEALWRLVRRAGIHAVSVRAVAAEAGTSPGALRHYFSSQDELLGFALGAVAERAEARVLPLLRTLTGTAGATAICEQFLPLDADRRAETEVYLAFLGRAQADAALRRIRDEADERARDAVRAAVALLRDDGAFGTGRDPDAEADRLYALLDGLAMHGALLPERYPPGQMRDVLAAHLRELAAVRA